MKFQLNDGTFAHLRGIVQTSNYRHDYLEQPTDYVKEIIQIAKKYLPNDCWQSAPMFLIGFNEDSLKKLMLKRKLPPILCVGEFVSYRKIKNGKTKATFIYAIWLQDNLSPHMSAENEIFFKEIDFSKLT